VTFSADLAAGRFGALVNIVAFGRYTGRPLFNDQVFGAKATTDLTLRYAIAQGIDISAGVQNLFDVRPDGFAENNLAIAATGGRFPTGEETPISANGRSFFARASARF
jgi:iron complex outermembrane recepter protein